MSHTRDLSVARAVFIAALLRSERGAPEISRDDATLLARSITRLCNICTTSNVKVCSRDFVSSVYLRLASLTVSMVGREIFHHQLCPGLSVTSIRAVQVSAHP